MQAEQQAPIPSLTGLRFYAAALIVWSHIAATFYASGSWLNSTAEFSRLGMTLFFVLSGFVIHYNYGHSVATFRPAAIRSFAVARVARLFPLYWFSLAIELAMRTPSSLQADGFWSVSAYYLTLTQDWFPTSADGKPLALLYIGSAWSISAEIFLYMAYIVVVRWIRAVTSVRTMSRVIWGFIPFVTAVYILIFTGIEHRWWFIPFNPEWTFYYSPYCRLPEFVLGALLASRLMLAKNSDARCGGFGKHLLLVGSIAWIVVLSGLSHVAAIQPNVQALQSSWGYAPASAGLIYYFAAWRSRASALVENPAVLRLGDASYSLYLLHGYPLWLLSYNYSAHDTASTLLRIVVMLIATSLLSLGAFHYLEVPARIFIRRVFDPKSFGNFLQKLRRLEGDAKALPQAAPVPARTYASRNPRAAP